MTSNIDAMPDDVANEANREPEAPTPTAAEQAEALTKTLKQSNEDRKIDRLQRQRTRAHEWRVQVWAQMELKIRGAEAELAVLGKEPEPLMETDFNDDASVNHYASMSLSK